MRLLEATTPYLQGFDILSGIKDIEVLDYYYIRY